MNIALSTLILFGFLIPGIFYRKTYFANEFSHQYARQSFFQLFIATITPSILFQIAWYFIANAAGYQVDFFVLFSLLAQESIEKVSTNISDYSLQIFWYNSSMWFVAAVLGLLFRKLVRYKKWDWRGKLFRYSNNWHYVFKGECYGFSDNELKFDFDSVEDIDGTYVQLTIEEDNTVYGGSLADYQLGSDGGLDSITLSSVQKFNRESVAEDNNGTVELPSEIVAQMMIFKYKEILHLNFTYLIVRYDENDEEFIRAAV